VIVAALLLWLPGCGGDEAAAPEAPEGEPIRLSIAGNYPPYLWVLEVGPTGDATVTRTGVPEAREELTIPAAELSEMHEQLDQAAFGKSPPRTICADCLTYTVTYGDEEIRFNMLSIPRDLEAPIRALQQLGDEVLKGPGAGYGSPGAELPTR